MGKRDVEEGGEDSRRSFNDVASRSLVHRLIIGELNFDPLP